VITVHPELQEVKMKLVAVMIVALSLISTTCGAGPAHTREEIGTHADNK
jgi:hypothetical protein